MFLKENTLHRYIAPNYIGKYFGICEENIS
jgi:hypothetical protein